MNSAGEPRGCPKYLKLAKTFERQLRAGVLRVGDRLPSVRQLRTHHRVSAATAVGCYMWLERQGYVRARPKSGFFVSRTPQAEGPAPDIHGPRARPDPHQHGRRCSSTRTPPRTAPASLDLGPAVVGAGCCRWRGSIDRSASRYRPSATTPSSTKSRAATSGCAGRSPSWCSARAPPALPTTSS